MGRNELNQLLQEKKQAKKQVFAYRWSKVDPSSPLLIIFAGDDKHSKELLFTLLQGLLVLPLYIIVVTKNQPAESEISSLHGKIIWVDSENPKQSKLEPSSNTGLKSSLNKSLDCLLEKYLLAADMALIFEEHQTTIKKLFMAGVIPIGYEKSPLLANYHPNDETGNSFTFNVINAWDIFSAIVRANETYRFPFDWQHIIRGILKVR